MKLLKTVPAAVMLAGALRLLAQWPMILYLPSWMTLPLPKPFEGVVNAGYGAVRQHQELFDDGGFHPDWYGNTTARSLWGNASNVVQ